MLKSLILPQNPELENYSGLEEAPAIMTLT